MELHDAARAIAQNHGFNIFDALVIVAALEARCSILYSEDLQDGQHIDGHLTVCNPFMLDR